MGILPFITMNIGKEIAETIKFFRQKKGWNGKDLGEKIGVSSSYIYQIERQEKGISLDMLEKIAHELRIDISLDIKSSLPRGIYKTRQYHVDFTEKGKRHQEVFSIYKYDSETGALTSAQQFLYKNRPENINTKGNRVGITISKIGKYNQVICNNHKDGKTSRKSFSIKKYGFEEALRRAINYRIKFLSSENDVENKEELHSYIRDSIQKKYPAFFVNQ